MPKAYAGRVGRSIARSAIILNLATAGAASCASSRSPGDTGGAQLSPATMHLLALAHAEERARNYDRARALYEQAARGAPDRPSAAHAWRELARALLFWGESTDAEAALTRAVDLAPGDVSGWHDLGILREQHGDVAGAERALRRAIALAPREPRPRVALGAILVKQRRWQDALDEYRALEHLALPERTRQAVVRAISLIEAEQSHDRDP